MKKRWMTAAAVAAVAVGAYATPAGATGPPVERFDGIYATCDTFGEIFAVSLPANQHAGLVPTFVLDGGQVLIPYSLEYSVTFTPTGGSPQTTTRTASRHAPARATTDHCVANGVMATSDGTYELHLEADMAVRR